MSAISKADVLETFADLYDVFEDNKSIRKELDKVYDRINALPSVTPKPEQQWISVSERLPEEYKRVLVSDVFGVYVGEFVDAEENWGGKHFIDAHGIHSIAVKAWQPLPEPYTER